MLITSKNQAAQSCRVAGLEGSTAPQKTTKSDPKTKTMTLFVNVVSLGRKIIVKAAETSTTQELKEDIQKQLNLPKYVLNGQLMHRGRALLQQDADLKTLGVAPYATVTVACT